MIKFKPISTAPSGKLVLLYWKNIDHYEKGTVYLDEGYHCLSLDGERINYEPSHWSELPETEVVYE